MNMMVINNRRELQAELGGLRARTGGSIGRGDLGAWMRSVWHSERVVFRCIGARDYQRICELLPDEVCLGPELEGSLLDEIGRAVRDAGGDVGPPACLGAPAHVRADAARARSV